MADPGVDKWRIEPKTRRADGDAELFARIKDSDLRAFEQLYRGYHPRLTRFLGNLVRQPQVVEEVLNDTMMVVWDKPDSFRGASRISTWIFGIAYRKAINRLRKLDEPIDDSVCQDQVDARAGPDQQLADGRIAGVLGAAVDRLSADHRAVIDLTYFHEMNYREIAEIMHCPIDTVKTRMFHARRKLKRALAGDFSDWV